MVSEKPLQRWQHVCPKGTFKPCSSWEYWHHYVSLFMLAHAWFLGMLVAAGSTQTSCGAVRMRIFTEKTHPHQNRRDHSFGHRSITTFSSV